MNGNNKSGFTLIELLVVIAIIGILSTLAIVALSGARQKARDAKRVADLNQIGKALELYYSDNNNYPSLITPGQAIAAGGTTYMASVPSNPLPRNDGSCIGSEYGYTAAPNQTSYSLGVCLGGTTGAFTGSVFVTSQTGSGPVPCGKAVVVDRDGNTYNTVQIGTQCWMAENLRTSTKPDGTAMTNLANSSERDCISSANARGTEADCTAGFTLYTWAAAMNLASTYNTNVAGSLIETPHRGICPAGWHIPTDTEQYTFELYLTTNAGSCSATRTNHGCPSAGDRMKSTGSSGFNVSGGGRRMTGSSFTDRAGNYDAWFWASTEIDATTSRLRDVFVNYDTVGRWAGTKTASYFVRCVKD